MWCGPCLEGPNQLCTTVGRDCCDNNPRGENMTKAQGFEIDVLGERFSVADIIKHMFLADQQSDEFFETLTPIELIKLSIMDNWLFNGGKLTAHCTDGHWYSAKAHRMDEDCPFCEASKDPDVKDDTDLYTFTAPPLKLRNANDVMKAETGSFHWEGHDVDMDVIERYPQVYIESVTEFEDLMDRLEKAEG